MSAVTIRNMSDETYNALGVRAAQNGRSIEAEVHAIIEATVLPADRVKLGSLLVAIGREIELSDAEVEALQNIRATEPGRAATPLPLFGEEEKSAS